jgi:hypothetical protein
MKQRLILKEVYEGAVKTNATVNFNAATPLTKPDSALRFLEKYKGILATKGIKLGDHPQVLGHGELGTAFKLQDNTVLKITSDPTEAKAARHILGKNFKNVYHIRGVYELSDSKIYVIWQELLERIDDIKDDREIVRVYYSVKGSEMLEWYNANDDQKLKDEIGLYDPDIPQSRILFKLCKDVAEGLKQLRSAGIKYKDYHLGNVMYRKKDDSFVLIDLGVSKSGGIEIDSLEPSEPGAPPQKNYNVPPGA